MGSSAGHPLFLLSLYRNVSVQLSCGLYPDDYNIPRLLCIHHCNRLSTIVCQPSHLQYIPSQSSTFLHDYLISLVPIKEGLNRFTQLIIRPSLVIRTQFQALQH